MFFLSRALRLPRWRHRCGASLPFAMVAFSLLAACTMMPPEGERMRIARIENAVLPLANAALDAGQLETARRLYVRLLEADAGLVDARMGLGDVALAKREPAQAANWYLAALVQAQGNDKRHAALLAHGRAALAAGDLQAARSSYTRLTDPEQLASNANVAWGFNGIGIVSLLEGEPLVAVAAMEKAVLHDPDEPRFQGNLTRALKMAANLRPDEPAIATVSSEKTVSDSDSNEPEVPSLAPEPVQRSVPNQASPADIQILETPAPVLVLSDEAATDSRSVGTTPEAPDLPEAQPLSKDTKPVRTPDPAPAEAIVVESPATTGQQEDADIEPDVEMDVPEERSIEPPKEALVRTSGEAGMSDPDYVEEEAASALSAGDTPSRRRAFLVRDIDGEYLQVGAYAVRSHAIEAQDRLREMTDLPVLIAAGESLFRVRIGPVPSREALPGLATALGIDDDALRLPSTVEKDGSSGGDQQPSREVDGGSAALSSDSREKPLVVVEEGSTFLQVGAYADHDAAVAVASGLRTRTEHPVVVSELGRDGGEPLYRVRIGPVATDPPQSLLDLITGEFE